MELTGLNVQVTIIPHCQKKTPTSIGGTSE